jgi:cell division protein ZapA
MEQIDVRILDRDYRLAVSSDEKSKLIDAVRVVDDKMKAIRDAGRIAGIDRIAVMAALQLAHELITAQSAALPQPEAETGRRIRKMTEAIDAEMKRQESLLSCFAILPAFFPSAGSACRQSLVA